MRHPGLESIEMEAEQMKNGVLLYKGKPSVF